LREIGVFHVDADGKLDVVIEEATVFTPMFDVVLRDGVLSFAKENDGTTDRYELRISGDTAKLSFLLTGKAIEGGRPPEWVRHSQLRSRGLALTS